jgi:hypothetical protein
LFADDAQLRKGLKGASDRLRAFGGVVRNIGLAFTALGVGITAPLIAAAKGLWYSLGSAVAPILKDLADRLRDGAIWLRDFAKEHPGLIRLAFRLGAG